MQKFPSLETSSAVLLSLLECGRENLHFLWAPANSAQLPKTRGCQHFWIICTQMTFQLGFLTTSYLLTAIKPRGAAPPAPSFTVWNKSPEHLSNLACCLSLFYSFSNVSSYIASCSSALLLHLLISKCKKAKLQVFLVGMGCSRTLPLSHP